MRRGKKMLPSPEKLHTIFLYDEKTGNLIWKYDRFSGNWRRVAVAGTIVGIITYNGYRIISADGVSTYAHRAIWAMTYGKWPTEIDHINGNKLDNRLRNLREATRSQNSYNKGAQSNNKSTGIKGVSRVQSISQVSGKIITKYAVSINKERLGYFRTLESATEAYKRRAEVLHGEFSIYRRPHGA